MKVLAVFLIILAGVISVVPQFTSCESQGLHLDIKGGTSVPMKCHWTARAELAVGIPFGISGLILLLVKKKESRIALGIVSAFFGMFTILLPTVLIGVCANPDMLCNSIMKPTLIFSGSLAIAISLAVIVSSYRRKTSGTLPE